MPRTSRRFIVPIFSALLCASSGAALAAGPDLDIGDAMLRPAASTTKEVGIGIAVTPGFVGRSNGHVGIDVEDNFGNGLFVSARHGFGYRFLETPGGWSMAASLGASGSRRDEDGDHDGRNTLRGMGDINAKVQANLFLNYDGGPFHANAALHQTLAARRGTSLDLSVGYDLFADEANLVRATAAVSFGNRSLMQTFYGVTPEQSARSGNWIYDPHAGLIGGGVGVTWRHAFNEHWIGSVDAGVNRLGHEPWAGPLMTRRTAGVLGASIDYRF